LPNRLHRWVTKESPAFSAGLDRHGGSAEPRVVATPAINRERTGNALAFESEQQAAVIAVIAENKFVELALDLGLKKPAEAQVGA
jgi:hypothetical protein